MSVLETFLTWIKAIFLGDKSHQAVMVAAPVVLGMSFPPVGEPMFKIRKQARARTSTREERRRRRVLKRMFRSRRIRGQNPYTGVAA
jgi:hypothetical protein